MGDLIERLRDCDPPTLEDAEMCMEAADEIERLEAALKKANARERLAFEAGWTVYGDNDHLDPVMESVEAAWKHYRCQDDADWKAISQDTNNV